MYHRHVAAAQTRRMGLGLCGFTLIHLLVVSAATARPVYFADANLKAVVEAALGKTDPNATDMLGLKSLFADSWGITNLTGLEYATQLRVVLSLSNNAISDLSPLANLTNLTCLNLGNNAISDVSPLANLTSLTRLFLNDNAISDVSPLANLTNLTYYLFLGHNAISDVSPLANLTNLMSLDLTDNAISDISPLANLTNLTDYLYLGHNAISDVSPLANLTNLTYLDLYGNTISDVSPLANLTNLTFLDLYGNAVSDVSPLGNPTSLTYLNLRQNPLNAAACAVYIPQIKANNPGIELQYDPCVGELYALTISSTPGGAVTTPGEGLYVYDEVTPVPVVALPDADYEFSHWFGTAVDAGKVEEPKSASTSALVDAAYTLTANFEPRDDLWTVVYWNDFEGEVGSEWSDTHADVTPIGQRRFLGQFANDVVTLTLKDLPPHARVRLSFDLFIIRTWDGYTVTGNSGPDVWQLRLAGGPTLLSTTFDNHYFEPYLDSHEQAYPGEYPHARFPPQTGASERNTLGYSPTFARVGGVRIDADAVYSLEFTFAHSDATLRLNLLATGLGGVRGLEDESWGLDNVAVKLVDEDLEPSVPFVASDPSPADGAEGVSPSVLRWKAGRTAVYHDVYFGPNPNPGARSFLGRTSVTECVLPYALSPRTTYYWRVDEVEADGSTIHTGEVWSFTVGEPGMRVLTVSSSGSGSALTPGEGQFEVPQGTVLTVEAAPADSANAFQSWVGTAVDAGKVDDPNAAQTTVLVDDDYELAAVFAPRAEGPVLGFSLGQLDSDDPQVFDYRVITNNTPEATFVELVTGLAPDPNGMIRMEVVADEPARAKTRFGRYDGPRVLVRFSYLFEYPGPDLELVAYLSDVPDLIAYHDSLRAVHYVEAGRVPAPPAGRPGAFGSGRFGVFQAWVRADNLDLSNGTWVELELIQSGQPVYAAAQSRGRIRLAASDDDGASVLIDYFTAEVQCDGYCMDLNGSFSVDEEDFLVVMAYCGAPAGLVDDAIGSLYCLDGVLSSDGYIDPFDLSSWDWSLSDLDRTNLCFEPLPLVAGGTTGLSALWTGPASGGRSTALGAASLPSELLILGKGRLSTVMTDGLYMFGGDTAYLGKYVTGSLPNRCNVRLVRDASGDVYAVNSERGVVRLTGAAGTIISPGEASYANDPRYHRSATVFLGLQGDALAPSGRPILDVAVDPNGYAYVVPVVVQVSGEAAYVAAAKLAWQEGANPPYEVAQLYDDPPAANDNQDPNHLREIEVDGAGNVYVVNAHRFNESDILWKYGSDGALLRRVALTGPTAPAPVVDPLALHVSANGQTLYLASGQYHQADANGVTLYRFSTADLQYQGPVTILGMDRVTGITEDPATGMLWVVGAALGEIPLYPSPYAPPFYEPCLAPVPPGTDRADVVPLSNPALHDLSLPTSVVWTGE